MPWVALFVLIAVGVISIWSEPGVAQAQTINNNSATGTPVFIGTHRVGEVLRVDTSSITDPDGLTNPDFSFTWLADNDLMELGSFLRGLGLVNAYEIAPYDAGMTIKVQIYFDDDLGNHEFINLQAPSTVAAAAPDQPGNLSASLEVWPESGVSRPVGILGVNKRSEG